MAQKIYLDGKLRDKADATVSVYDHGLLYGDGVFEGIRAYNGKIFEPKAHIARLYNSAKAIRLAIPMTREECHAAWEQPVAANGMPDCYLRARDSRGVGNLGIDPRKCSHPSVIIIVDK